MHAYLLASTILLADPATTPPMASSHELACLAEDGSESGTACESPRDEFLGRWEYWEPGDDEPLVIEFDQELVRVSNGEELAWEVDASHDPAHLDLVSIDPEDPGRQKAIFRFDGTALLIALADPPDQRPTSFDDDELYKVRLVRAGERVVESPAP